MVGENQDFDDMDDLSLIHILEGVCTKARRQCTGTGRFCDDFGRKLEVLSALVTKQRRSEEHTSELQSHYSISYLS